MKIIIAPLLALFILGIGGSAWARGGGGGHSSSGGHHSSGTHSTHTSVYKSPPTLKATATHAAAKPATKSIHPKTTTSPTVVRDSNGRIKRSPAAKLAFEKQHPCPSTGKSGGSCPGYVVDHVKPLASGGADAPSNMQWQTIEAGKAKDKTERKQ